MIGQTLAHYKITGLLGKGGMGEVYRAEDSKLHREVAIKVLPEKMASDPERLERFQREARSVAALNHPRIVTIHSVEEVDGVHLLTMEVVEGKSLDKLLPGAGFDLEELFDLGVQIADGLAAAHEKGITHRDLKPANVMVTNEGRVKILDFGLAKLAESGEDEEDDEKTEALTQDGLILGTVPYMSPEQLQGRPVDPRSDIFSFGTLLFEMATGSRPFQGDDPASVISAVLKDQPPTVTALKPALPNHLARILRTCLEKAPGRRYPMARQVHRELEALREEISELRGPDSGKGLSPKPPARLGRIAWLAAGAAVLALFVFVMARFLGDGATSNEPASTTEAPRRSIAIIGFENLSDPTDRKQISRVLSGLVTTDLAESGGLKVASTARVRTALKLSGLPEGVAFDPALAQAAAEQTDANAMLTGQVLDRQDVLTVTAELVDVASGDVIESLREEASESELFELAERISDGVRERLLPTAERGVEASFDLARGLTGSPEAYRFYTAGELAYRERRFEEAYDRFSRAVELDPTFALAYFRLSNAMGWSTIPTDDSVGVLERGLPYVDRLPPRWQKLYRAFVLYRKGDFDGAYTLGSELAESVEPPPDVFDLLGEIATHSSRYWDPRTSRDRFERVLEIDPTYRVVFQHLIQDYILTDDLEAGRRLIRRFAEEVPGDPAVVEAEALLLAAQRRFGEAVEVGRREVSGRGLTQVTPTVVASLFRLQRWGEAEETLGRHLERESPFWRSVFSSLTATSLLGRGQFQRGVQALESAIEVTSTWDSRRHAGLLTHLARVLSVLNEPVPAADAARRAVESDPFGAEARYWLGTLLFGSGRQEEASVVLAEFREKLPEWRTASASFWLELLEGERLLAEGDLDAAVVRLRKIETFDLGRRDPATTSLFRARLHQARGELAEAIATYENLLTPSYLTLSEGVARMPQIEWPMEEIPALFHQARLMEMTGDVAGARRRFREFLSYWGEADVDLPWVTESRRQLASLDD